MNFVYRFYQDPDRPLKVTYAVFLLYAFLAIDVIVYFVRTIVTIILIRYPEGYFSPYGYLVLNALARAVVFVFQFYVVKKIANGRNWARWLLFIGFALMFVLMLLQSLLVGIRNIFAGSPLTYIMTIGELLVAGMAVFLLFQQPSSDWFKSKSETAREEATATEKMQSIKADSEESTK